MALEIPCTGQELIDEINGLLKRDAELQDDINTRLQIKVGTYTGGGDGVMIPVDFKPKLLVVGGKGKGDLSQDISSVDATFCVPYGQTSLYVNLWNKVMLFHIDNITWSEDSISWTGSNLYQANGSGSIYHYVVIG